MEDATHTATAQPPNADDGEAGRLVERCADLPDDCCGFSCPVCGAEQPPAEECRRCRADLMLFLSLRLQVEQQRFRCLALVRQRRLLRATEAAKECLEMSADGRNLRLLATCYLLQGDFRSALSTLAKAECP